ncbi:hypothetical protein [Haloarchaeobius sp. TZWWS8]|uniref:hypothetical protein n=1 Tax=Haloarchaeobius sp. TZWWS8 TaxID=3446121 RepID=UPI003EBD8B0E
MALPSRRHVLQSLVGASVLTSGCLGTDGGPETETATATERSYSRETTSPETQRVRNASEKPAVTSSDVSPLRGWTSEHWAVASTDGTDALQFAEETTGTADAIAFVEETDLSTYTVVVDQYTVGGYSTREIDRLRWQESDKGPDGGYSFRVDYEVVAREGDCQREDETHVEATFVRIPAPVEHIVGFASSW